MSVRSRFCMAVLIGSSLLPCTSFSSDRGITPGHTHAVWESANRALLRLAGVVHAEDAVVGEMARLRANVFSGKRDEDLESRVIAFHTKLGQLHERLQLKMDGRNDAASLLEARKPGTQEGVFLVSGHVLDEIVTAYLQKTADTDPVSDLFVVQEDQGSSVDGVFGLVDLAHRRLDLLLAR
ncbi:MAG: hypothetical protein KDK91_28815 [Gammaproteobacteria bacterium]|nr:hypothetical protein [Gammaproteobacteria bacterium]